VSDPRNVRCRTDIAQAIHHSALAFRSGSSVQHSQYADRESAIAPGRASHAPCPAAMAAAPTYNDEVKSMLYTIALILLVLWALGLVTSYTLGGFIHVLLVVAVVMALVNLFGGRRTL
jgi:hypothetical protein